MEKVVILAVLVEAVLETLKMCFENGKFNLDRCLAVCIGVGMCIGANVDLLAIVGVPMSIPYAGQVLSGLIISRGANFVHDLLTLLEKK